MKLLYHIYMKLTNRIIIADNIVYNTTHMINIAKFNENK